MPEQTPSPPRTLIAVATPGEANALARAWDAALPDELHRPWRTIEVHAGIDLVVTGVGKANAAGGVASTLHPRVHDLVLSVGIAGALPLDHADEPLAPGSLVVASTCIFADEGLISPGSFQTLSGLGFPSTPTGEAIPCDARWTALVGNLADATAPIASVSTCSGTDESARDVRARTGALAEAMEGAAVALVAARLGVAMVEVRAISNTTGNRATQRWDLRAAFDRLSEWGRALPRVLERGREGHDLRGV